MRTVIAFLAGVALTYCTSIAVPREYVLNTVYHQVKAGETTWEIAEKHFELQDRYDNLNEWVFFVRKYNALDRRPYLRIGDIVELPLYSEVRR